MFKKILVAIDGSKMSEKVLETVVPIAKENGSEITIIHVSKELVLPRAVVVTDLEKILSEMRNSAIELLNEAQHKLKAQGVDANYIYKQGSSVSRVIVEVAQEKDADLIIIGSRGLGNIKGMMLGGVSQKVAQLSVCPILIVK